MLKWAREEGCVWDKWTNQAAAEGNHVGMLEWLFAEGCPWDEDARDQ